MTELDLSDSRAAGRLFADAADASRWLPNLAKVTGLGGFEVDVAALRRVESPDGLEEDEEGPPPYPMAGVSACIRGEGEAPMEVLLAAFTLRHGEARVPANAFRDDTSMTSIALPAGLTSLGEGAFNSCSSLTSIELPAGLTSLGEYAFSGCSSMTSIELPAGLTSLGECAFSGCSSMTLITLPAGLTSLGEGAFWGCSSMTSIALPAGLTSLGEAAFYGCSSMTSIEVPALLDENLMPNNSFWLTGFEDDHRIRRAFAQPSAVPLDETLSVVPVDGQVIQRLGEWLDEFVCAPSLTAPR